MFAGRPNMSTAIIALVFSDIFFSIDIGSILNESFFVPVRLAIQEIIISTFKPFSKIKLNGLSEDKSNFTQTTFSCLLMEKLSLFSL